jgi:N6-adenosine-specific RNA methylase IME4
VSELHSVPGGFGCILADPPWSFTSWTGARELPPSSKKTHYGTTPSFRGAHDHYVTTDTEVLADLSVARVAAKDCALFMWVVDSHFDEALELGRAWGFGFKTCAFVWLKSREGYDPVPGMGYWTRKQTEQCWLFTRGKPKRLGKGVNQVIHCPRGAHSAKPEIQYDRIEALVGGPYLELFARTTRPGWSSWGNQVGVRDGLFGEPLTP